MTAKKRGAAKASNTDNILGLSVMTRSILEGSVVVVLCQTTKKVGSIVASSSQHRPSDNAESVVEWSSHTGDKGLWKHVITWWEHCGIRCDLLNLFLPDTVTNSLLDLYVTNFSSYVLDFREHSESCCTPELV